MFSYVIIQKKLKLAFTKLNSCILETIFVLDAGKNEPNYILQPSELVPFKTFRHMHKSHTVKNNPTTKFEHYVIDKLRKQIIEPNRTIVCECLLKIQHSTISPTEGRFAVRHTDGQMAENMIFPLPWS